MKLRIDEEFRDLLPPLTGEEYEGLRQALKQHGCLDTIKVWGDTIVDGHNRYKICNEEGIEYRTQQIDFANRDEVIAWICGNQDGRRNLNEAQRIRVSKIKNAAIERLTRGAMSRAASERWVKSKEIVNGVVHPNQPINKAITQTKRQKIAEDAKTSEAAVQRYNEVERNAPELMKPMYDGKVTIATAHSISKLDADKRKEFVKDVEAGVSAKEAAAKVRSGKEEEGEKVQFAVATKPEQRMYDPKDFVVKSNDLESSMREFASDVTAFITGVRMRFMSIGNLIVTKQDRRNIRDGLDKTIDAIKELKEEYR